MSQRSSYGGVVYHVFNRANGRKRIFDDPGDYRAFEEVLFEARARFAMRILDYCVMPNHWHLMLWPTQDGHLRSFMQWMTLTHAKRWHAFHGSGGTGHVYQGRYRFFPVQTDDHLLTVCRYIERNPVRAGLVHRAEDWRFASLWLRIHNPELARSILTDWPIDPPRAWLELVNAPQTSAEAAAFSLSLARDRPFGSDGWKIASSLQHGLPLEIRPRGRPKKTSQVFLKKTP